jgi:epsilon-lactone hydrolase
MSWQAVAFSAFLRNTYKRYYGRLDALEPRHVRGARRRLALVARLLPPGPRGVRREAFNADGIDGERTRFGDIADTAMLYLHGGAYAVGTARLFRELAWRLARACRASVCTPEYRLAPESPFPAALDDAVRSWEWLCRQGFDPGRIVVAGDSAGGGLALALCLRLRERKQPLPGALVCLSPWTDLTGSGESLRTHADSDAFIVPHLLPSVAALYAAGEDPRNPLISPLFADLGGLPPMRVHASRSEALFSDSARLVDRARQAGVEVGFRTWDGLPHVFHQFARILPEAREAIDDIGAFVRGLRLGPPTSVADD